MIVNNIIIREYVQGDRVCVCTEQIKKKLFEIITRGHYTRCILFVPRAYSKRKEKKIINRPPPAISGRYYFLKLNRQDIISSKTIKDQSRKNIN